MVEAIAELGYRGLDAPDAKAAIEILKSNEPINLLVTDVGLPNMNGRQLAEIARRQRPALKVLFVTGYAEHAAVRGEFLASGMEMLTKPITLTALGTKIQSLLTN
jgi:CheY-like chemotaxis protein